MRRLVATLGLAAMLGGATQAQDPEEVYRQLREYSIRDQVTQDGRVAALQAASSAHTNIDGETTTNPALIVYLRSQDSRTVVWIRDEELNGLQPRTSYYQDKVEVTHTYDNGFILAAKIRSATVDSYTIEISANRTTTPKRDRTLYRRRVSVDDVPRLFRGKARRMNTEARALAEQTYHTYLEQISDGQVPDPFITLQPLFKEIRPSVERSYDGTATEKDARKLADLGLQLMRETF